MGGEGQGAGLDKNKWSDHLLPGGLASGKVTGNHKSQSAAGLFYGCPQSSPLTNGEGVPGGTNGSLPHSG